MSPPWPLCALLALLLLLLARAQEPEPIDESSYTPCECDGICECVYFDRCGLDNYIITTGEGRLESRTQFRSLVRKCPSAEKCCKVPTDEDDETTTASTTTTTTTAKTTTTTTTTTTTSGGVTTKGTTTTIPTTTTPTTTSGGGVTTKGTTTTTAPGEKDTVDLPPENSKGGCGVRRNVNALRIMGDDTATSFGEFPWMVTVMNVIHTPAGHPSSSKFKCAGSLISHSVVLTAAHCVYGFAKSELGIRAGDWDLAQRTEPLPFQDRKVIKLILHPEFHNGTFVNDVALLVLRKPLDAARHVDTICLPQQGASFTGQRCLAAGWGKGAKEYVPVLRKVELPVVERKACQTLLRKTTLGRYFKLHKSFICAGGEEGRSACMGDGGGPLICQAGKDGERYVQAGIVSTGLRCGYKGIPAMYANLGLYSTWIAEELAKLNIANEALEP